MNKELELFRKIVKGYTEMFNMAIHHPKDTFVKWEGVEEIENALKALEIIKEKRVDIGWLIRSENCSKYNLGVGRSQALKKTEYDLLKEVLL